VNPVRTTTAIDAPTRAQFPILERQVNGRPLVYLDSAATAHKPLAVIEAEAAFYKRHNANVHRGLHTLADEATTKYEDCRSRVAEWIEAHGPESVVITQGTTAALNLAARGLAHTLRPGDEILLTEMEHHANLVPWQMVAGEKDLTLRFVPLTRDGRLDLEALPALLGPRTKIVSLTAVSNVLGTINPVAEVAAAARAAGALVVVDAAQAVGHMPLSLAGLDADLLAFSAHKCYGPLGLGFLVGKPEVLAEIEPQYGGGEMIEHVEWQRSTWAEVPHRFEAGTPNIAAAAAFPPALAMLSTMGLAAVREHERRLVAYAWEQLSAVPDLRLLGPTDPDLRGGLISFVDQRIHPHDQATLLDEHGIAVRAGHHCAQPLHRRLGIGASVRASFGVYSRTADVDALIAGLHSAREVFQT